MSKEINLLDIVMKLNGSIEAVGTTHIDGERYDNLQELCMLSEDIIYLIGKEATNINKPQSSVHNSGERSLLHLKDIKSMIDEVLEDLEMEDSNE